MGVRSILSSLGAAVLSLALSAWTLSRPHYVAPDVSVGQPAFVRAIEAFWDGAMAAKLTDVFRQDLAFARSVTADDWRRHSFRSRASRTSGAVHE